jgi:putative ABC transport system substrate-binding protein
LGNPVALGLAVSDSRHPSGNLTGVMPYVQGLPAKQLEFEGHHTWQYQLSTG